MFGVALNRAKAKARLFSEAKVKASLGASTVLTLSEANLDSLKAKH